MLIAHLVSHGRELLDRSEPGSPGSDDRNMFLTPRRWIVDATRWHLNRLLLLGLAACVARNATEREEIHRQGRYLAGLELIHCLIEAKYQGMKARRQTRKTG